MNIWDGHAVLVLGWSYLHFPPLLCSLPLWIRDLHQLPPAALASNACDVVFLILLKCLLALLLILQPRKEYVWVFKMLPTLAFSPLCSVVCHYGSGCACFQYFQYGFPNLAKVLAELLLIPQLLNEYLKNIMFRMLPTFSSSALWFATLD